MDRDQELIKRYREEGDEDAFVELIHDHITSVYNLVSRLVGAADADDVTQDVFIKTWKQLKTFKQGERFRPWILAIARNTAIDRLRKKTALPFSILDTDQEFFEETIPDDTPLPDAVLAHTAIVAELEAALETLAPQYREIVVLHVIEELTFEEIAGIVGRPMNTVKSQYRRAIAMLREVVVADAPK